jgi:hypothetical protein
METDVTKYTLPHGINPKRTAIVLGGLMVFNLLTGLGMASLGLFALIVIGLKVHDRRLAKRPILHP